MGASAVYSEQTEQFVSQLDAAIGAHLEWMRRVLRCAVLQEAPGAELLAPDASKRCRFGQWFRKNHDTFEELDPVATTLVLREHERMHDAARALCSAVLATGRGMRTDFEAFEAAQSTLVSTMEHFKTRLLAESARYDALTSLPLRYGLEEEFVRCRAVAQRHGVQLVLLLADVDHFKTVNDAYGHAVGDQALRHIAYIFLQHSRADEPVFRFGGEEFLVLLQASGTDGAAQAAERLFQSLRDSPLALEDGTVLNLRISAGLATVGRDEKMAEAIDRADRAMYAAKAAGRDRWAWAEA
ncbi:MAG TPA: diguanylate cyclase [Burkholderiaceae bacterium]|nr:diguanylate cyclase [Burkholderiaceae bacterium]